METKIVTNSYNKNSCKYDKLIKINYLPFIFFWYVIFSTSVTIFLPQKFVHYDLRMSYIRLRVCGESIKYKGYEKRCFNIVALF